MFENSISQCKIFWLIKILVFSRFDHTKAYIIIEFKIQKRNSTKFHVIIALFFLQSNSRGYDSFIILSFVVRQFSANVYRFIQNFSAYTKTKLKIFFFFSKRTDKKKDLPKSGFLQ